MRTHTHFFFLQTLVDWKWNPACVLWCREKWFCLFPLFPVIRETTASRACSLLVQEFTAEGVSMVTAARCWLRYRGVWLWALPALLHTLCYKFRRSDNRWWDSFIMFSFCPQDKDKRRVHSQQNLLLFLSCFPPCWLHLTGFLTAFWRHPLKLNSTNDIISACGPL